MRTYPEFKKLTDKFFMDQFKKKPKLKKCCENCRHWKQSWNNKVVGNCVNAVPFWNTPQQCQTLKHQGKTCNTYHAK